MPAERHRYPHPLDLVMLHFSRRMLAEKHRRYPHPNKPRGSEWN